MIAVQTGTLYADAETVRFNRLSDDAILARGYWLRRGYPDQGGYWLSRAGALNSMAQWLPDLDAVERALEAANK